MSPGAQKNLKDSPDTKEQIKLSSRSPKASKNRENEQLTEHRPSKLNENVKDTKDGTSSTSRSPSASKKRANEETKTEPSNFCWY